MSGRAGVVWKGPVLYNSPPWAEPGLAPTLSLSCSLAVSQGHGKYTLRAGNRFHRNRSWSCRTSPAPPLCSPGRSLLGPGERVSSSCCEAHPGSASRRRRELEKPLTLPLLFPHSLVEGSHWNEGLLLGRPPEEPEQPLTENSLLEVLDGAVMMYNLSVHQQLGKVSSR